MGLSGRYRVVVSRDAECTDIVRECEFSNLITDNGLELLGTTNVAGFQLAGGPCARFCVGSGTSAPSFADTALQTLVATAAGNSAQESQTSSYTDGYLEGVYRYQFLEGVAAGNLSEIGIGPSATSLFSRARILDASGNPTTITVLGNEFLTVFYTLRCSIPQTDATFTFDAVINGVPTPVTSVVRPSQANGADSGGWQMRTTSGGAPSVFAGDIGTPVSSPAGATANITAASPQVYTPASHQRTATISASISQGNVTGGLIKSLRHGFGPGTWQMNFTPALPKDNTKTITFTIGYSWARV